MFTTVRVLEEVTSSAASVSRKSLCILSVSQCKRCLFLIHIMKYMPCKPHSNSDFQLPVKNSSLVQQTDLKIDQNMVSVVHDDRCVECMHLLLRCCNLFVLGIWKVGTWNLCDVFKLTNHCDDICCL